MPSRHTIWTWPRRLAFGVAALAITSLSPAHAQSYTQEQQQLCSGDAFRLCSSEIPDVDRVTACMVRLRAQLSPGCRAVFGPAPSTASSVAPMRSRGISMRAKAGRKMKARTKAKKSAG